MAKNESSKSKAEIYREERKERIAKANKKNAKSIEKRNNAAKIAKKVIAVVVVVAIVLGIGWKFVDSFGLIEKATTAMTVGSDKISTAEFAYYYNAQYQQMSYMSSYYAQSGYNIGFDSSKSPDDPTNTTTDADGNKITWAQYFTDSAVERAQFIDAYYKEALKADFKLSEDEQKEIEETVENYRKQAAENNFSLSAYLKASFGEGFNEKTFRKQLEMETIAQNFYNDQKSSFNADVKDSDIEAEYKENTKKYNYADVRFFAFTYTTLSAAEGESEDELKARQTAANNELLAKAKEVYAKCKDADSFIAAVKAYKNEGSDTPSDADATTLTNHILYSAASSSLTEKGADWLFDGARKAGDITLIEGEKGAYIIMCVKPSYTGNSVNVRHCLIKFNAADENNVTDEEKKAAYDKAKKLYDSWLGGDKTEDSFKTLVTANSEDTGSVENGGLYENIRITDSYVSEFLDWSFADGRKVGDSGIIETTYGYHIMYFVSDNTDDLDWKNTIRTDMGKTAFDEYNENLLADDGSYKVVENETWTSYVSKDFCKKFKKNLAYSSASKK